MDPREFNLDKYLRASGRVALDGVEWDRIGDHPSRQPRRGASPT